MGEQDKVLVVENGNAVQISPAKMRQNGTLAYGEDGSGDVKTETYRQLEPPDGGARAWLVMLGSFFVNGILFGVMNTYSLIYNELQKQLELAGDTDSSSKAALVGSLTIGTTFFLSPVSGILTDRFGIRKTTLVGGAIASLGMLMSSFFLTNVTTLYLTYGVMYGLGAALAYTPSLVILGHYFKRYLGIVNGVVTTGSSMFTAIMAVVLDKLINNYGLQVTLRVLSVLVACIMLCALLFKPLQQPLVPAPQAKSDWKTFVNVDIWKRRKYVIWALAIPLTLFGYFVPYVHIGKFIEEEFKPHDKKLPIMCIGITSGIGRLIFGYVADLPRVNRILLQQIAFVSIGLMTILLTFSSSFGLLLFFCLGMGFFDGCFITLLGPIAFDICGKSGATQAIGFLLGMCSIPLTVGPPIAGKIYDKMHSYALPFQLAGIPPIIGALVMCLIRCVKDDTSSVKTCTELKDRDASSQPLTTTKSRSITFQEAALASTGKILVHKERPLYDGNIQQGYRVIVPRYENGWGRYERCYSYSVL